MAQTRFSGPVVSDNGFVGSVTGNITGEVTGIVNLPGYTLSPDTLPDNATTATGAIIFVSDATNVGSGTGTICFNDGTDWIDISTGIAVV
jgi:hypothetical protein